MICDSNASESTKPGNRTIFRYFNPQIALEKPGLSELMEIKKKIELELNIVTNFLKLNT